MPTVQKHPIHIKRAYVPWAPEDGYRILVDRLWPRGLSKERIHLDLWAKDIAPSTAIRLQFGHREERFEAFWHAYQAELSVSPAAPAFVQLVGDTLKQQPVTLVYAARSETINHARVLMDWLHTTLAAPM